MFSNINEKVAKTANIALTVDVMILSFYVLHHFKYSHINSLTFVYHQKFWVSGGNFHPNAEIPLKGNSAHLSWKEEEPVCLTKPICM